MPKDLYVADLALALDIAERTARDRLLRLFRAKCPLVKRGPRDALYLTGGLDLARECQCPGHKPVRITVPLERPALAPNSPLTPRQVAQASVEAWKLDRALGYLESVLGCDPRDNREDKLVKLVDYLTDKVANAISNTTIERVPNAPAQNSGHARLVSFEVAQQIVDGKHSFSHEHIKPLVLKTLPLTHAERRERHVFGYLHRAWVASEFDGCHPRVPVTSAHKYLPDPGYVPRDFDPTTPGTPASLLKTTKAEKQDKREVEPDRRVEASEPEDSMSAVWQSATFKPEPSPYLVRPERSRTEGFIESREDNELWTALVNARESFDLAKWMSFPPLVCRESISPDDPTPAPPTPSLPIRRKKRLLLTPDSFRGFENNLELAETSLRRRAKPRNLYGHRLRTVRWRLAR